MMKDIKIYFIFCLLLNAVPQILSQEFVVKVYSNDLEVATVDLTITREMALAKFGGVTEQFDLSEKRWQHDTTRQWVPLEVCKTWAIRSKEKTLENSSRIPEQARPFLLWNLDPKFEIDMKKMTLTMKSGQVDYTIDCEYPGFDLTSYFLYAKLNAYKKAILAQKIPPFSELAVLDELERRKLLPKTMQINITGAPNAPSMKTVLEVKK